MAETKTFRNQQIVNLRQEGGTYQSIADEYGLTTERVRQIIKKTAPHLVGRDLVRQLKVDRITSAYLYGLSVEEIAHDEKLSEASIRKVLRRVCPNEYEARKKKRTSKYEYRFKELAEAGLSVAEIARVLGIHKVNASQIKKRCGIATIDGRTKDRRLIYPTHPKKCDNCPYYHGPIESDY